MEKFESVFLYSVRQVRYHFYKRTNYREIYSFEDKKNRKRLELNFFQRYLYFEISLATDLTLPGSFLYF